MLGGGDGGGILAVRQVMFGPPVDEPQGVQRPVDRGRVDHPTMPRKPIGQIRDRPGGDWIAFIQRGSVQHRFQPLTSGGIELRRSSGARAIGQAGAAVGEIAYPPGAQPALRGMQEPGDPAQRHPLGHQEQAIGAMANPRIRVGPGQLIQAIPVRGEVEHDAENS